MAGGENFPVASRLLPPRLRRDLTALYGFARLADEIGDTVEGDRLAKLDWLEHDVGRAFEGAALHPLLQLLQPVIAEHRLPEGPFLRLIEANRRDQRQAVYESWDDLLDYCSLSANPVGELVLGVLDAATPELVERSDAVCTALQLVEHWQDVREDAVRGRVYLPQPLIRGAGLTRELLSGHSPGPAGPAVVAEACGRAWNLLRAGPALVAALDGPGRIAVAGFVGGGRAALAALAKARYDVWTRTPKASRGAQVRAGLLVLIEARRR